MERKFLIAIILLWASVMNVLAQDYLCFTAEESGSTVGIKNNSGIVPDVQYSFDKKNWSVMKSGESVTLECIGDCVFFRGFNTNGFSTRGFSYSYFVMTGLISASGNLMSLIDGKGDIVDIPCQYCFYGLFRGCSSLITAPKLPAINLYYSCYEEMFYGCNKLERAPFLPATKLEYSCYHNMFYGCSHLKYVSVNFDDWNSGKSTGNWLYGVAKNGYFECPTMLPILGGDSYIPNDWYVVDGDVSDYDYLSFKSNSDDSYVSFCNYGENTPVVQYSFDKANWRLLTDKKVPLKINSGIMYLRGKNEDGFSYSSNDYSSFVISGSVSAGGNVMSLIDGKGEVDEIPNECCFYRLFYDCQGLVSAPFLSANELKPACYSAMFSGCIKITKAPDLPAEQMVENCYASMFKGCSSLIYPPDLNSINLDNSCYYQMFYGCSSLEKAPFLPAVSLALGCYRRMFYGCSKLNYIKVAFNEWDAIYTQDWVDDVAWEGTFVCPDELNLKYGAHWIPVGWGIDRIQLLSFVALSSNVSIGFDSFKSTPNVEYSYDGVKWFVWSDFSYRVILDINQKIYFRGYNVSGFSHSENDYTSFVINGNVRAGGNVMSLVNRVGAGASVPDDYCFYRLFGDCEGLLTPPELPSTTLSNYCYARMFENCKALTYCPNLPAQELKDYCYYNMFFGCESLLGKPDLPKDNLAQSCYGYMFYGCPNINEYWDDVDESVPEEKPDEIYVGVGDLNIAPNKSCISVYPNPAGAFDSVTIKVDGYEISSTSKILIQSYSGSRVLDIDDVKEENVVYLPTGFYVGVLLDRLGMRKAFKIVVR